MQSFAEQYAQAVAEFRRQKDEFFRTGDQSPIPEDERGSFGGLRYFPADLDFRVEARVERLPPGALTQMVTSDNNQRTYERYALLHFFIGDQECALAAYRSADNPDAEGESLFVPFRDALSGHETYGAGRYLDVYEEPASSGSGMIAEIDFNLAYNPYCAYNDNYSCPITPAENTLAVAIRAGERAYRDS